MFILPERTLVPKTTSHCSKEFFFGISHRTIPSTESIWERAVQSAKQIRGIGIAHHGETFDSSLCRSLRPRSFPSRKSILKDTTLKRVRKFFMSTVVVSEVTFSVCTFIVEEPKFNHAFYNCSELSDFPKTGPTD